MDHLYVDGTAVADFELTDRGGVPWADLVVLPGDIDTAVRAATDQWAGWYVSSSDNAFIDRLLSDGAAIIRDAFVMTRPLTNADASDESTTSTQTLWTATSFGIDGEPPLPWARILPSWRRAYPQDHPDHESGDDGRLITECFEPLTKKGALGDLLTPESTLALDRFGSVIGGIIINNRPGEPPFAGPWVSDIWRDPASEAKGVGSQLLRRAIQLLAGRGFPALSLTVSQGNPARHVYEREGFVDVLRARTVRLR